MPRLMVQLSQEEFDRLYDRASYELRHPRHTARLLLRDALNMPQRDEYAHIESRAEASDQSNSTSESRAFA